MYFDVVLKKELNRQVVRLLQKDYRSWKKKSKESSSTRLRWRSLVFRIVIMILLLWLLDFHVNFLNFNKQVIEFTFSLTTIDDYVLWLFTSEAFFFCDHFEKSWVDNELNHDWSHWEDESDDRSWEDSIEEI